MVVGVSRRRYAVTHGQILLQKPRTDQTRSAAQAGAPPDTVAEELEAGADFHFVVHNAAGMVSVQEQISVTEALIRLRAFAFSHDRLLAEVAGDVVARRLRLG